MPEKIIEATYRDVTPRRSSWIARRPKWWWTLAGFTVAMVLMYLGHLT